MKLKLVTVPVCGELRTSPAVASPWKTGANSGDRLDSAGPTEASVVSPIVTVSALAAAGMSRAKPMLIAAS